MTIAAALELIAAIAAAAQAAVDAGKTVISPEDEARIRSHDALTFAQATDLAEQAKREIDTSDRR